MYFIKFDIGREKKDTRVEVFSLGSAAAQAFWALVFLYVLTVTEVKARTECRLTWASSLSLC